MKVFALGALALATVSAYPTYVDCNLKMTKGRSKGQDFMKVSNIMGVSPRTTEAMVTVDSTTFTPGQVVNIAVDGSGAAFHHASAGSWTSSFTSNLNCVGAQSMAYKTSSYGDLGMISWIAPMGDIQQVTLTFASSTGYFQEVVRQQIVLTREVEVDPVEVDPVEVDTVFEIDFSPLPEPGTVMQEIVPAVLPGISTEGQRCPQPRCRAPPSMCPEGSTLGNINFAKKCGGEPCCGSLDCGGCVSNEDDTVYVDVPECYYNPIGCDQPRCADDEEVYEYAPAGLNGAAPCCPEWRCRKTLMPFQGCPIPMCMGTHKCPEGSTKGTVNMEKICADSTDPCCGTADCGGCVDNNDDTKYVPVPACYVGPIRCPMMGCEDDEEVYEYAPAGLNGAAPCCPVMRCRMKKKKQQTQQTRGKRRCRFVPKGFEVMQCKGTLKEHGYMVQSQGDGTGKCVKVVSCHTRKEASSLVRNQGGFLFKRKGACFRHLRTRMCKSALSNK